MDYQRKLLAPSALDHWAPSHVWNFGYGPAFASVKIKSWVRPCHRHHHRRRHNGLAALRRSTTTSATQGCIIQVYGLIELSHRPQVS